MNCGNKYITSLPKLLAARRPSPGAGLLWQNLGNFLRSEETAGLVGNEYLQESSQGQSYQ